MRHLWRIVRESIKLLIIASLLSSLGGLALEGIKQSLIVLLPLLIALPALNDMLGDFGIIASSKLTTELYLGRIRKAGEARPAALFAKLLLLGLLSASYLALLSGSIAVLFGIELKAVMVGKLWLIAAVVTILLLTTIFWSSTALGIWLYRRGKDPANYLIPYATSAADLGSMVLFSLLVMLLF